MVICDPNVFTYAYFFLKFYVPWGDFIAGLFNKLPQKKDDMVNPPPGKQVAMKIQ